LSFGLKISHETVTRKAEMKITSTLTAEDWRYIRRAMVIASKHTLEWDETTRILSELPAVSEPEDNCNEATDENN
jgi:hypothetical protein